VALTQHLVEAIREVLAGHDWREALSTGGSKGYLKAVTSATDYLRKPGDDSLAYRCRRLSGQLARAGALCPKSDDVQVQRPEITFYEEVRVWMAKFDAADRQARGEPIPDDIQRLLGQLIATSTASGEIDDICAAAGRRLSRGSSTRRAGCMYFTLDRCCLPTHPMDSRNPDQLCREISTHNDPQ